MKSKIMDSPRSVIPAKLQSNYSDWHFSPGHWAQNVLFLSGCTGCMGGEEVPLDFAEQCRAAFRKVELTLVEANLDFSDIVELTTYHVGLKEGLDVFKAVKDEFIIEPYPAWTAIGVSELAVEGALIEIRATASKHDSSTLLFL